ncbi:TRAF-type zinc finger domain-containing protein 1-like [Ruditapes philippinarum]|uniref:TRAF-type zinc finger domain-containing protein 1-like n=1 Tax=Ruditapes philippinarum TaxID=129788 RepID=UPI00295BA324|nr:TRAF-type zinc finger domain-containing protein 1-like [Ruditapes philippinarum]
MGDSEPDTKLCNNCKKQISANNFVMHEMHCKRHISLCEQCNEPIPKNEMEVHYEENHAKIKCPKCETEVEKMHLEEHEENSCSKKPMQCVYCELEFPKDKLDSHLDYCGSRTEPCPKCGQFIMLKEQTKHDDSNCTYPEVKPKNNNVADGHRRPDDFLDDIFRSRGGNTGGRSMGLNSGGHDFGGFVDNSFGADYIGSRRQANVRHTSKVNNKKPAVDKHLGSADRESEYDRLLAMHLAKDLHQDNSMEEMVREFNKPQSPTVPSSQVKYGRNSLSEDLVMIPCEFCGEPFDADDLVQHQSGCSLERISAMLPQMTTANNVRDVPNSQTNTVQPPSIINNLQAYGADEWLDDTAETGYDIPPERGFDIPPERGFNMPAGTGFDVLAGGTGDDQFLPCEFCNELFPLDNLIQHQAMCDRMTMTPLPPTPPHEQRPKPKKKNSQSSAQRLAADFPNLNSKRHQPPPSLFSSQVDSDEEAANGAAHRVHKPKPSSINGTYKSNITSPARETRSTLKKYGVETPDRGDYYTGRSSFSRQSSESGTDSWLEPSQPRIQRKYATGNTRTRSTLDNLLNDNTESSSHDLLGHIGGAPARRKEARPIPRQKATVTTGNTRSTAKVRSNISAKDVQKEMSRYTASNASSGAAQNRSSKPNIEVRVRPNEADELSDLVTGSRQRTRANNVFGAQTNKTSTKRRTDNR